MGVIFSKFSRKGNKCLVCNGTGKYPSYRKCSGCYGSGYVSIIRTKIYSYLNL